MVKVRFAPSPTGIPHIGNTRTALFDYLFAKKNNGQFVLRVEDTDQKRLVEGAREALLEILEWLGLKFDGEITYQSQRLDIYHKYAKELVEKQIAYEKEGAIWVKVPDEKNFEWEDLIGKKHISFAGKDVEDFVILKSDGFPTYHLANVIDDHLMEITHVIRGEEWISSTPKHLYLYESLGWEPARFAHLPVILGPDKTKLSKRHGAKSALDYRAEGYLKESLLNYMALLGWNPGGDKEQMSLSEMENLFALEDVNTANPIFDQTKLEWLNGVWIREIGLIELKTRLIDFYKDDNEVLNIMNSPKSDLLISAATTRMKTLKDFKNLVTFAKTRERTADEKEIARKLSEFLIYNLTDNWEDEELLSAMKEFSKTEKVPFKTIFFLLTGKEQGIGILELNQIFGKDFLLSNLK